MLHSAKSRRIIDMIRNKNNLKNNFRTIIQNIRTTSLGQNLLVLIQKSVYLECFQELFLTVVVLISTFEHKSSLRTIEAQIVQRLKNNEARPKFPGCYKKKACISLATQFILVLMLNNQDNILCSFQSKYQVYLPGA